MSDNRHTRFPRRFFLALLSLAVLGGIIGWFAYRADSQMRADLLREARMVARMISLERVDALKGTDEDLVSADYQRIKDQLTAAWGANPKCRFVYLLRRKGDGRICFLVDSEKPDSPDYSPPGQIYDEVQDDLLALFITRNEAVQGPSSDRWGTWVSGAIPLFDPKTGELVALFGMDIEARNWWRLVATHAALPATLALLAELLGLLLIRMRQVNRTIRESEQELQGLFRVAPVGLGTLANRVFLDVNARFCEKTGYGKGELINQSARMIYPDDREYEFVGHEMRRQITEHGMSTVETRFRRKDGRVIDVLLNSAPSDPARPEGKFVFTAMDITERKRADEAFRKQSLEQQWLLRSMANAFALLESVFDKDGRFVSCRFVYINDACERITGLKNDAVKGKTMHEVWPGAQKSWVRAYGQVAVTGVPSSFDMYHEPTRKLHRCNVYRPWDTKDRFCVVFEDITERKKAEERIEVLLQESDRARKALLGMLEDVKHAEDEVRTLNEELEQRVRERTIQLQAANKDLEAFAYSVSHDLRTPLRTIEGFSQAVLTDHGAKLDPEGREDLERVCTAAKKMSNLIDDILMLSRLSRQVMKIEPVDLSRVASGIASELHKAEPARKVDFVIAPEGMANGDERLLRVVMQNLLNNAWKFTGKTAKARIEFGVEEQNGKRVFFIRDNGSGFDMAYADKLFGVFQRLHSEAEFEGTGIGLATVQRIILRHGGQVWGEGEVGKGATFYFTV